MAAHMVFKSPLGGNKGMVLPKFPNQNFMQFCWFVPDVRAAILNWVSATGAGPFFWFDNVPFEEGRYRGKPAEFPEIKASIGYHGDMQIEFVAQDNDKPSIFRDLFKKGQSGLHHVAIYCKDYEAERDAYIKSGAELAFEGRIMGTRTSWVDTSPTLGFMVELLEAHPGREATFKIWRDLAQDWDGKDPVRPFSAAV